MNETIEWLTKELAKEQEEIRVLLEENKRLVEIEKEHQKINGALRKENKQLQERIQDAISCIKDTCIEQIPDMPKGCYRETASIGDLEELLEILGEKND